MRNGLVRNTRRRQKVRAATGIPHVPAGGYRLSGVMGRAGVVALELGLGLDAAAIQVHDEGVLVLVYVAHGPSC